MRYFLFPILFALVVISCRNSYEKEHQDIVKLQELVNSADSVLLTADTAKTFSLVREIKQDLWQFGNKYDSLDKDAAFKVADYYQNKKSLYFFAENYSKFNKEIKISKEQLIALQNDLDNGLITQEQFLGYYDNEQQIITVLNNKITNAVKGLDISISRIEKSKAEIKELLKGYEKVEVNE